MTNDGDLAHRLAHPRYGVEKTYVVELTRAPSDAQIEQLAAGVDLEDGPTAPAKARRITKNVVELTIHEGRNRQVKRMMEAIGHRVTRLHRSHYAGLSADDVEPGSWRELEPSEVQRLRDG
jgi:23S rRNA pseudouridine2605 synthase